MHMQLDPMLPMTTPKGPGYAFILIDYSQEHDVVWGVADDATGEIWFWRNQCVRFRDNITMGRPRPATGVGEIVGPLMTETLAALSRRPLPVGDAALQHDLAHLAKREGIWTGVQGG